MITQLIIDLHQQVGKYYVFGQVEIYGVGQSNIQWVLTEVWKNGTSGSVFQGYTDHRNNYGDGGNAYGVYF